MKKLLYCLLAVVVTATLFAGCSNQAADDENASNVPKSGNSSSETIKIVSTIFPQYDWVRQILGDNADNAELTLLLNSGVDLHSYQPTVDDIVAISTCDMFIYVGGESDAWVEDALAAASNEDMVVINLLEVLGDAVVEEEIIEGMEHDHDHSHEEIDPDNIGDRELSYYAEDWVTIENALNSGAMDGYVQHNAEANETDFDSQMTAFQTHWASDYPAFEITENGLVLDGTAVAYRYAGYELIVGDDSVTVWYGYEAVDTMGVAPKFIAFNDHTAESDDHDHEHEHEDEHDHEKPSHFHMRYGDESLSALVEIEGWAPTYFLSSMSNEAVAEAMSGHSHDEAELDEHVWLSLRHAQTLTTYIADKLGEVDPENSAVYTANANTYNGKLSALDAEYQSVVDSASIKTLLFADRFPFRYLVDDYNLDYYAAFSGCSAETEASFETIVFLATKINELRLENILVIESSDKSIAETVSENTNDKNQQILVLDSIQSVTSSGIASGATYLSAMESNLAVLEEALK